MAKQNTRSATLVLRVRPALKAALEGLATNERRSISNYVEIILEDHVQKAPSRRRSESLGCAPANSAALVTAFTFLGTLA
jgi:hypothetical protein